MGWSKPLSPLGASPSQLVAGTSSLDVPAAHGAYGGDESSAALVSTILLCDGGLSVGAEHALPMSTA